ncbi:kinesin-like protein KIF17 [Chamaea fasciata]|uniref:kinesin-like protein KIF17 n=1 Tax=Chamaea fasciata TaxID=190680 RepID=UPI00336A9C8C
MGARDLSGLLPAEAAHLGANPASCLKPLVDLEAEKQLIREEFQESLAQLQASCQAEQVSRARLEKDISSLRDDFDLKVSVLQDLPRKEADMSFLALGKGFGRQFHRFMSSFAQLSTNIVEISYFRLTHGLEGPLTTRLHMKTLLLQHMKSQHQPRYPPGSFSPWDEQT